MEKILFNDDWLFSSDVIEKPYKVTLPHDAMQTEKRVPELMDGSSTGFYPGGKYTYIKNLFVEDQGLNETHILEFEGVYQKASVFLNGNRIGGWIYGYSNFLVDLTGLLKLGSNELKVIADNTQTQNSRWYSGSGIYRNIYLHTSGKSFIKPYGVKITTISTSPAKIRVIVDAVADKNVSAQIQIFDKGQLIAKKTGYDTVISIENPKLWSVETPHLYDVKIDLMENETIIDTTVMRTGIRSLDWNSKKGFLVNGQSVKLRGGCVHHDNGPIGAVEMKEACLRKVRIMKKAGFNAVRIAHNPASPAMLEACDELGLYVMNESFDTWKSLKSPYDYGMYFEQESEKDLLAMIRVSYNHPSVIMYSIGNEVMLKEHEDAVKTTQYLVDICKREDNTRPVTNCINPMTVIMGNTKDREVNRDAIVNPRRVGKGSAATGSRMANILIDLLPKLVPIIGSPKKMKRRNGIFEPLDIVGFNYSTHLYEPQHKNYSERVVLGAETFPQNIVKNWSLVKQHPWLIGDFLWTAWDYLGETGIGSVGYDKKLTFTQEYPTVAAGCSNIDLIGEINCQGYYTAVVYGEYKKPYIAVHPIHHAHQKAFLGRWRTTDAIHSWSWQGCEGTSTKVDVYSNAETVELYQDGKTLGKKKVEDYQVTYTVTYTAGELKAVHYDRFGKTVGEDILVSAENSNVLTLYPEKTNLRADSQDLLYLPIELTDKNGIRKMLVDENVTVTVEGAAVLFGLGSASLTQTQAYTDNIMKTYHGKALAILRSNGKVGDIKVVVSSPSTEAVKLTLNAR